MNSRTEKQGVLRALWNRMFHTYFLMTRGLTIGVRAVVRSDEGKFLLVRHTYIPGWHFPGGGVEKGETAAHALGKELLEETGLKLIGIPVLHGVFHNDGVSKRDHVLVYLCEVGSGLPSKPNSLEIAEVKYFSIANLPKDIELGTLRRMQEIVNGAVQGETW